jgi:hypothetical protein
MKWEEGIKKVMRAYGIYRWKELARNKGEWAKVVQQVKHHPPPTPKPAHDLSDSGGESTDNDPDDPDSG